VDAGFSGKDTDRPAFKRMIAYIQSGGVDAIAVTKLDRLARSVRNLCEINEDTLKGHGVHLICTRDGINPFELTSGLLMHLLALIGQIERENISKRVAAAMAHIHDMGGSYCKVPAGKTTRPHPTEPSKLATLADAQGMVTRIRGDRGHRTSLRGSVENGSSAKGHGPGRSSAGARVEHGSGTAPAA
jgi:DNA invertase Pin-like site-specific DNA recombinase